MHGKDGAHAAREAPSLRAAAAMVPRVLKRPVLWALISAGLLWGE